MCLKRLKTSPFGSSKPLLFLRLNGRVGAIPTYRVYRLYDRCVHTDKKTEQAIKQYNTNGLHDNG